MSNKEIVKKYLNKYFPQQYLKEDDYEFKSLVRILNKKDKKTQEWKLLKINLQQTVIFEDNKNLVNSIKAIHCMHKNEIIIHPTYWGYAKEIEEFFMKNLCLQIHPTITSGDGFSLRPWQEQLCE